MARTHAEIGAGWLSPGLALLRPHHWAKNLAVAAPLAFTPEAVSTLNVGRVLVGILAFSLVASIVYIVNDLRDRAADRLHPQKRYRPLASGAVSPSFALAAIAGLLLAALLLVAQLPRPFAAILVLYVLINLAYSFGLKNLSIVDVMVIAIGFVLRVKAGAALIGVAPSVWMITCTGLLALFLAIAKRRDDVVLEIEATHRSSLAGYNRKFLDVCLTVSLSALLICYIIYTTDPRAATRLGTDGLYLTVPFVAAGVLRYLQITFVEERSGAPTEVILTDPFLLISALGWFVTFVVLVHG